MGLFMNPDVGGFLISAGLGTVNTDINSAAAAGQELRGVIRSGADPGKAVVFNVTSGAGTGDLLIETDYGYIPLWTNPNWTMAPLATLRPEKVRSPQAGVDAYVFWGAAQQTQTIVNYRVLWVAKSAAPSLVITSQIRALNYV